MASVRALVCATFLSATVFTVTPALALPEGRAYEMVSPPYKGGYSAFNVQAVAPDGESVAFASAGAFDGTLDNNIGNDYLARRGESGWSTTSLEPPASVAPPLGFLAHHMSFSPTLEQALSNSTLASDAGAAQYASSKGAFLMTSLAPGTAPDWRAIGPNEGVLETLGGQPLFRPEQASSSSNFCHVMFAPWEGRLLPEAPTLLQLYDLSRGCDGEAPSLRLIAVKNEDGPNHEPEPISQHCAVYFGGGKGVGPGVREASFNELSADGSEIFFAVNVEAGTEPSCQTGDAQLFVRLGGERTLEVSKPLEASKLPGATCKKLDEVPCEPGAATRPFAAFEGASEDGSRVFFTTEAKLTSEDEDGENDLYMASIGCPVANPGCTAAEREVLALVQVSHSPILGEAADVQDTVSVSADGSHVYYVARGILSEGANAEGGQPVRGADNLYLYERDARYPEGHTVFVADLCSGPERSGEAEDASCPNDASDTNLWHTQAPPAQTTGDGRFLVFDSYARLITSGPQADTDNAVDVYRYDVESSRLERVSVGEAGFDANGNGEDASGLNNADAAIEEFIPGSPSSSRAISEDGSRIVFSTVEPLSPGAINGLSNVYEWHEGSVSLISSGSSPQSDCCAAMTPSGDDIFFTTAQGLLPQDIDGVQDIYDARLAHVPGEQVAFPPSPAGLQHCAPGSCQGSLTSPAPLLVPGSVSQAPGENQALGESPAPAAKSQGPKKKAVKRVKKKRASRKKLKAKHASRARKANMGGRGRR